MLTAPVNLVHFLARDLILSESLAYPLRKVCKDFRFIQNAKLFMINQLLVYYYKNEGKSILKILLNLFNFVYVLLPPPPRRSPLPFLYVMEPQSVLGDTQHLGLDAALNPQKSI